MSQDSSLTRRTTDGLLGAVAVVVGAVLIVATRHLPYVDRTGPGPALAPALVGLALIACGVALIVSSRGVRRSGLRVDPADGRIAATLGVLLAASIAIDVIGLAITAMLVVLASVRIVPGARLVHAVALAVVIGAALIASSQLLGTPLTHGQLGDAAGRIR